MNIKTIHCFFLSYKCKVPIVWLKPFSEPNHIIFFLYFKLFVICVFYEHIRDEKHEFWTCLTNTTYIPASHKCLVGDNIFDGINDLSLRSFHEEKTERNNECKDPILFVLRIRFNIYYGLNALYALIVNLLVNMKLRANICSYPTGYFRFKLDSNRSEAAWIQRLKLTEFSKLEITEFFFQ